MEQQQQPREPKPQRYKTVTKTRCGLVRNKGDKKGGVSYKVKQIYGYWDLSGIKEIEEIWMIRKSELEMKMNDK